MKHAKAAYLARLGALALGACLLPLPAQQIYLRSAPPSGVRITFATKTTPVVLTTSTPHGLQADDIVGVYGLCQPTSANGVFRVKSAPSTTTFSIKTLTGEDVAANAAWDPCEDPALGYSGTSAKFAGKLTPYSLTSHPRIMMDGPSGATTRKVALGVHNGLVNITVQSGVATVTTSYNHEMATGNSIGVWNSGVNNLNGTYAITVTSNTTYTFSTAAGNGVYTGAGMRISAWAHTNNPVWLKVLLYTNMWATNDTYRSFRSLSPLTAYALMTLRWYIDPSWVVGRDAGLFHLQTFERATGVNFACDETKIWCGNGDTDYLSIYMKAFGLTYTLLRDYIQANWSAEEVARLKNKIWADKGDGCSAPSPLANVVETGQTAGAGASSITLAAEANSADSYYTDVFVEIVSGPGKGERKRITSYTGSTRTAAIDSPWTTLPTTASEYRILASILLNRNGQVVGKLTRWLTDPNVNQRLKAGDGFYVSSFGEYYNLTVVSSVTSDTTMTASGGNGTDQAAMFWQMPAWHDGQCGAAWFIKHHPAGLGWNWRDYPVQGGVAHDGVGNTSYSKAVGFLSAAMAMADDDPRAAQLLSQVWSFYYDYLLKFAMHYHTGFTQSGAYYTFGRTSIDVPFTVYLMRNSVLSWPDLGERTPYIWKHMPFLMYGFYPTSKAVNAGTSQDCFGVAPDASCPLRWGSEAYDNQLSPYNAASAGLWNLAPAMNSGATVTRYWKSWLQGINYSAALYPDFLWLAFFALDPNVTPLDYRTQSLQYLFRQSSPEVCLERVGMSCVPTQQAGGWMSRTGWSSTTDTLLTHLAYDFWDDHSLSQAGAYQIHKGGFLVAGDAGSPHGFAANDDANQRDSMIELGGANFLRRGNYTKEYSDADIQRWAGDDPSGVSSNEYVYSMVELAKTYRAPVGAMRVQRHMAHMKKSGTEELVVVYDDIATTAAVRHRGQVHYVNNGGTGEGTTSCTGGCASLNANREIHSDNTKIPMTTKFFSPAGNLRVYTETGPQCTGTQNFDYANCGTGEGGYAAGHGWTFRVSYCHSVNGDACDDNARATEAVVVHKLGTSLTDTTLTATALNPEEGWTGVQTTDKVVVFSRGGVLRDQLGLDTSGNGTMQYLIAGLNAGLYQVKLNGLAVSGSPFTVRPNDSTLYFEGTGGRVEITHTQALARLQTTPASLAFLSTYQSPQTATQSVVVSAVDGEAVPVTVAASETWLQVNPTSGTTPLTLNVSANSSTMEAGERDATLTLTSAGAVNSPLVIPVRLHVSGTAPELRFTPSRLQFQGTPSEDPAPRILNVVTNNGLPVGGTVRTSTLPMWLEADTDTFSTPQVITFTAHSKGMVPGIYLGTVVFQSTESAQSSDTVLVELMVLDNGEQNLTAAVRDSTTKQLGVIYGRRNLPANTSCQVDWSLDAEFATIAGTFSDTGGAAYREAALGTSTALTANTDYYVRVACGAETVSFAARTASTSPSRNMRFSFGAHPVPGYTTLSLGLGYAGSTISTQSLACATGCQTEAWRISDRLTRILRSLKNSQGVTLAAGGDRYTAAR